MRVDRIRRQKADLEDILVHVHGETPARGTVPGGPHGRRRERRRIVADYEATKDKPAFTPWQVAASTALRDGDAAAAIAAHHARGRFHIGHDEDNTLTRLVDDWDRYRRIASRQDQRGAGAHPGRGPGAVASDARAPVL